MKYPGTALLIILFSAGFTSCTYKSDRDIACGRWKPISIIRDGKASALTEDDYLQLSPDSTFYYQRVLTGRKRRGRWDMQGNKLLLTYDSLSVKRSFVISELSGRNLKFSSNNAIFSYIRLKN